MESPNTTLNNTSQTSRQSKLSTESIAQLETELNNKRQNQLELLDDYDRWAISIRNPQTLEYFKSLFPNGHPQVLENYFPLIKAKHKGTTEIDYELIDLINYHANKSTADEALATAKSCSACITNNGISAIPGSNTNEQLQETSVNGYINGGITETMPEPITISTAGKETRTLEEGEISTNQNHDLEVTESQSVNNATGTSTSRTRGRKEDIHEKGDGSYHPCHYLGLARQAFLKCFGMNFSSKHFPNDTRQRKDQ